MPEAVQGSLFGPTPWPEPKQPPALAPGAEIHPRDYQSQCWEVVRQAKETGVKRQLISMATGLGKTVVFAQACEQLGAHRILVLAHREELLKQAKAKLEFANPDAKVTIEQADRIANPRDQIVVASTATLGRTTKCKCHEDHTPDSSEEPVFDPACLFCNGEGEYLQRIRKFARDEFDVIIVDEAHHALGKTYLNILRYFECGEDHGPLLLGFTATPFRGDSKPLSNVFDEITYDRNIEWGIQNGWLVPVRGLRITTSTDLRNVSTRAGDFAKGELAQAANTDYRNSIIISAVEDHCQERESFIAFCIDVAHAEALNRQFNDRGIDTKIIIGETDPEERKETLQEYKDGLIRGLISVGVLTEGFDAPNTSAILMTRPTKSPLLYAQMIGRGTRVLPGVIDNIDCPEDRKDAIAMSDKPDMLVIDIVDACGRHSKSLQTASKAFGMRDVDLLGKDILSQKQKLEDAGKFSIQFEDGETVDDIVERAEALEHLAMGTIKVETVGEAIDVFETTKVGNDILQFSEFPWQRISDTRFVMGLKENGKLAVLAQDSLGRWQLTAGDVKYEVPEHDLDAHEGRPPLRFGDKCIKKLEPDFWRVKANGARWRHKPASDRQKDMLSKLGFRVLPPGITAGAASNMIDNVQTKKRLAKQMKKGGKK